MHPYSLPASASSSIRWQLCGGLTATRGTRDTQQVCVCETRTSNSTLQTGSGCPHSPHPPMGASPRVWSQAEPGVDQHSTPTPGVKAPSGAGGRRGGIFHTLSAPVHFHPEAPPPPAAPAATTAGGSAFLAKRPDLLCSRNYEKNVCHELSRGCLSGSVARRAHAQPVAASTVGEQAARHKDNFWVDTGQGWRRQSAFRDLSGEQ